MIQNVGDNCTGCNACVATCSYNAIELYTDNEGFWRPHVSDNKCVECKKCVVTCPIFTPLQNNENEMPKTYAAYSTDVEIRTNSSSGGMFYHLARRILRNGGMVSGAAYIVNENVVEHTFVENLEELKKLQKSKYVQSYIDPGVYKKIQKELKKGREVLFSGTPCQIAGLKNYLKKEYSNLLTVDIVCHGVPSPKAWRSYVAYIEKVVGEKIKDVSFRSKDHGWTNFDMKVWFENNVYTQYFRTDMWGLSFIQNIFLRNCCYHCKFKGFPRNADISLGDFWEIPSQYNPDDLGCSLVLINTEKGEYFFSSINSEIWYHEMDIELAYPGNALLRTSSAEFKNRVKAFKLIDENVSFEKIVKNVTRRSMFSYCKSVVKKLIKFL